LATASSQYRLNTSKAYRGGWAAPKSFFFLWFYILNFILTFEFENKFVIL
jgi:hypothetical protein